MATPPRKIAQAKSGNTMTSIGNWIEKNEKRVEHPYLDNKGFVTIGVGFKANDKASFIKLPLVDRNSKRPLSNREKSAAFAAMEAERRRRGGKFNAPAKDYESVTAVEMLKPDIDARLNQEVTNRSKAVAKEIGSAAWNRLSDGEKVIAVDVHFANNSLNEYEKLKKALKSVPSNEADATKRRAEIAEQSLFFSGRDDQGRKMRNWDRVQANYCGALGLSGSACTDAMKKRFPKDAPNERPWKKLWPMTKKSPSNKTPPKKSAPIQMPHLRQRPKSPPDEASPEGTKMLAQIRETGETVDEIIRKPVDAVSEQDIDRVIAEKTIMQTNDPRRLPAEDAVTAWFDRNFSGNAAGGRPMGSAALAPTDFISARNPDRQPVEDGALAVGRKITAQTKTDDFKPAIIGLQNTLNRIAPDDPPLLKDGIFGPKTSNRLRSIVARHGVAAVFDALEENRLL